MDVPSTSCPYPINLDVRIKAATQQLPVEEAVRQLCHALTLLRSRITTKDGDFAQDDVGGDAAQFRLPDRRSELRRCLEGLAREAGNALGDVDRARERSLKRRWDQANETIRSHGETAEALQCEVGNKDQQIAALKLDLERKNKKIARQEATNAAWNDLFATTAQTAEAVRRENQHLEDTSDVP